jgi:hypothetical protein
MQAKKHHLLLCLTILPLWTASAAMLPLPSERRSSAHLCVNLLPISLPQKAISYQINIVSRKPDSEKHIEIVLYISENN